MVADSIPLENVAIVGQHFALKPPAAQMISVQPYTPERKKEWDAFIGRAKNGLFLFFRDYMEYHADRYTDASLMFYDGNRLLALFPASLQDGVLSSHGGLTFGGVVSDDRMTASTMLTVFSKIADHARSQRLACVIYKAIPYPFFRLPAQEDLYALFLLKAKLVRRDLSSVIRLDTRLPFAKGKKQGAGKAGKAGVTVSSTGKLASFMPILRDALARHGVKPTHTLAEIELLRARFPENIRFFSGHDREQNMLSGVIMYEYGAAAHVQYMASSDEGKKVGALDLVIDYLVNQYYPSRTNYFSFGISTEQNGLVLNAGLCAQKEMFGARSVVHDFYELDLASSAQ